MAGVDGGGGSRANSRCGGGRNRSERCRENQNKGNGRERTVGWGYYGGKAEPRYRVARTIVGDLIAKYMYQRYFTRNPRRLSPNPRATLIKKLTALQKFDERLLISHQQGGGAATSSAKLADTQFLLDINCPYVRTEEEPPRHTQTVLTSWLMCWN